MSKKLSGPLAPFKKLTKLKENLSDLTYEEAKNIFSLILKGEISHIKTAVFLTSMRVKGETPQELLGVIDAIKETMNFPPERSDAVDLAINYDGKDRTLYILPSSLWLLGKLGLSFTSHFALKTPTKEGTTLYEVVKGMGADLPVEFSDQKDFAPALYKLMPLRRELGFRSLINSVEKFLNPFKAKRIIGSVFHKPYFEKNESLLSLLDLEDFTLIKGVEGGIEPLPDRPTLLKRKGKPIETINPKDLGLDLPSSYTTSDVLGDSIELNLRIIRGEEKGTYRNWAVYCAAIILYAVGGAKSVKEAVERVLSL